MKKIVSIIFDENNLHILSLQQLIGIVITEREI